jgi:hypothetical protein
MPIGALLGGVVAAAWGLPSVWLVAGGIRVAVFTTAVLVLTPAVFARALAAADPAAAPDRATAPAS